MTNSNIIQHTASQYKYHIPGSHCRARWNALLGYQPVSRGLSYTKPDMYMNE